MPSFKTTGDLKAHLNQRLMVAALEAQEKIYQIINDALKEYYGEFQPEEYLRTYQLLKSFVKSDIETTARGYKVKVYFDLSAMDYSWKYINNYRSKVSNNWDAERTMENAAVGRHGSRYEGTSIWNDPTTRIKQEIVDIVKSALHSAGIPVK